MILLKKNRDRKNKSEITTIENDYYYKRTFLNLLEKLNVTNDYNAIIKVKEQKASIENIFLGAVEKSLSFLICHQFFILFFFLYIVFIHFLFFSIVNNYNKQIISYLLENLFSSSHELLKTLIKFYNYVFFIDNFHLNYMLL